MLVSWPKFSKILYKNLTKKAFSIKINYTRLV